MAYYFNTTLENADFDSAIEKVTAALKEQGFGIISEIDIQATMKKKLDVEVRPYRILGACNPQFAYQALQVEDKIGTMLPCNVIVQEDENGRIEVAAVDPEQSMQAIQNEELEKIAGEVQDRLRKVIASL
ncbi:DUF302 domain-containing protein [Flavilitoribacter nigricans]|uniref:DUF302 domain-containing protein n=1 Tax=Flavilitoribacter nigricans (strain ATCC 23147 / DSM 23189 / NBRC 102662 / NCIMB 1420 / SS-2) TaxID=1122177 RepID=A0A2D0NB71_FLAN2|nr:DUF302 domain-containing protein [Flavilitoribacter nigricans]PHN05754.1 hypothetical protein CRP01_14860 [Flavilitoribacter nigricans DSM 23189 = NBRC 102662]